MVDYKDKELFSLLVLSDSCDKFCIENKLNSPIVTTINKEGNKTFKELNIQFLASSAYAYTVGKNTLEQKMNK